MRGFLLIAGFAVACGCSAPNPASSHAPLITEPKSGPKETFLTLNPAGRDLQVKAFQSGAELLKEVERLGGPRGEYETDSAYHGRISKLGNFSVAGKITPSQIKFDPVTGEFALSASMHDAKGFGFKSSLDISQASRTIYPSFDLGEDIYHGAQYSGQNAYGASALITKRSISRYYLVFSPVPQEALHPLFFRVSAKLSATAAEMERERDNVRVVFTVATTPNYLQVSQNFQQPKISNPFESVITNYFFSAKVFWVKVVNVKSGKVYADEAKMSISTL